MNPPSLRSRPRVAPSLTNGRGAADDVIALTVGVALRHPGPVLAAAGFLAALGWWSFARLPLDAVPDLTNVQVQVNTPVDALAPLEIEVQITQPVEAELGSVPGAQEVRSLTKVGLSQVTVVFADGTDLLHARQLVAERLGPLLGRLPPGAIPAMAPMSTGLGDIVFYALKDRAPVPGESGRDRLTRLRTVHDWDVRPRLRGVPGVADVNAIGGLERQWHVLADHERLAAAGLSLGDLAGAVERGNRVAGGGFIQRSGEQVLVRSQGRVAGPEDLRGLPVRPDPFSVAVTVGQVARVEPGAGPRTGAATLDGEEEVTGIVMMSIGGNGREVARRAVERIREVGASLPGLALEVLYNREALVTETLRTVRNNLFEGAAGVVAVLLLFLGNVRAALIVAAAIPLSMLFAVTGMARGRVSGNLMSLGAIDFGLIVDGAVVVVENCVRHIRLRAARLGRPLTREEVRDAVQRATVEIRRAAGFGELLILLAYVPVFFLGGLEGKMFRPMAATVCLALAGAFVLSFTVIPVLAARFLPGAPSPGADRVADAARRWYRPLLGWSLTARGPLLAGTLVLAAAAAAVFSRLGGEFMPALDEGSVIIQMIRPPSIGVDRSLAMQKRSERIIRGPEFPEVSHVFSRLGTPEIATDPMGVNISDTFVQFKPRRAWPRDRGRRRTKVEVAEAIRRALAARVPGQSYLLTQPIQMRFDEMLAGAKAEIVVKVFGDDFGVLNATALRVKEALEGVRGAGDVEFDALGSTPALDIVPDRDALRRLGVTVAAVNEAVEIGLGGRETGLAYDAAGRPVPIVVRLPEEARGTVAAIRALPVEVGAGGTVPLAAVAAVRETEQVSTIVRESGRRRVAVLVNPRGRDLSGYVAEASRRIRETVTLPAGTYLEWGGQFENLASARRRLLVVVPLVLLAVFLMVYGIFRRWWQAALVFAGVPLALIGGIFALAARGIPLSVSTAVGFIALSGVAVLNGLVMVSMFNALREEGRRFEDAVTEGALIRLRPVLMTALVACLGFVPMALATGTGAEVQRPLATVVIGGLASSTLLTLLLLPSAYCWIGKRLDERRRT